MNDPTVIIGEAVAGQSAALRKRMRILAADLTKHTFDIAEAFFEAQETRCYAEWGFASLPEYAELELGIKQRKSQYLARIVRVCRACGVKRADYEPAGITNLRTITMLDPDSTYYNREEKQHEPMVEHIVRLIAEAPELSTKEVDAEVQRLMGNTGENAMITRMYRVTVSAYENTILRCFESIRKHLGSAGRDETGKAKEYSDGKVIESLCAEWNADPRNFMEEGDESHVQFEVPLEENNVAIKDQSAESGTTHGDGQDTRALDSVASAEVLQEQL